MYLRKRGAGCILLLMLVTVFGPLNAVCQIIDPWTVDLVWKWAMTEKCSKFLLGKKWLTDNSLSYLASSKLGATEQHCAQIGWWSRMGWFNPVFIIIMGVGRIGLPGAIPLCLALCYPVWWGVAHARLGAWAPKDFENHWIDKKALLAKYG